MSDLDDILWAIQRQSRALQDVVADARQVWRDANARAAEQRFLQPRVEAEGIILKAVSAQHQALSVAAADLVRADEQHRLATQESGQVGQAVEQASRCAQSALSEAGTANDLARQADGLSAEASGYIAQANSAGG
jgi:hypothetical protein